MAGNLLLLLSGGAAARPVRGGAVLDHHVGADGNVPAGAGRADPAAGSPGDGRGHGGMADPVFPFRAGNDAADPQHQRSLVLVERRHGLFDGVVLSGPSDGPVASSGGQPEGKSPVSASHGAVKRGGGRRQFRHAAVRLRAGRAAAVLLLPAEGKEPLGQADLLRSHAGGLCLQHDRPGQRRAGTDPFRGHERRQGHSGILLFRHGAHEPILLAGAGGPVVGNGAASQGAADAEPFFLPLSAAGGGHFRLPVLLPAHADPVHRQLSGGRTGAGIAV